MSAERAATKWTRPAGRGTVFGSMWRMAVVCAALTGCSFIATVKAPPGATDLRDGDCTDGLTYPGVDATVTVLSAVLAVNLLSSSDTEGEVEPELRASGFGVLGVAAAFLASATYGAIHVNRCRTALRESGVVRDTGTPTIDEGPLPGQLGGRCNANNECEDELICDAPMKTCIPLDPESDL